MSGALCRDWDDFVDQHPDAGFFHRAGWRTIAASVFGHRAYPLEARRGGAVTGVAPLVQLRSRLFGNALVGNAFCVGGGPVASDPDSFADLLDQAERLGRKLGVNYVELRDTPEAAPAWVAKGDLYATFDAPLCASEEDGMKAIPRRQRAVVRKALQRDMSVTVGSDPEPFYPLYATTMRDHGTPALPRRYFKALAAVFGADCEFLTVSSGGRPIASVLSYFHKGRVLPYYTGSHAEARQLGANDLMYWALMRRAVDRGCSVFDFGRSKVDSGPFAFKRNWGFEPRPITHQYRLLRGDALPQVNPTNPRYGALIRAWRALPLPVATAISPFLSRSLG